MDGAAPGLVVAVPAAVRQQAVGAAEDERLEARTVHSDQRQQLGRDGRQVEELELRQLRREAGQDELAAVVVRPEAFGVEVDRDAAQARESSEVCGARVDTGRGAL